MVQKMLFDLGMVPSAKTKFPRLDDKDTYKAAVRLYKDNMIESNESGADSIGSPGIVMLTEDQQSQLNELVILREGEIEPHEGQVKDLYTYIHVQLTQKYRDRRALCTAISQRIGRRIILILTLCVTLRCL